MDLSSPRSTAEYYDWMVEADQNNLFYRALQAYYDDTEVYFTATVEDTEIEPGILAPKKWWDCENLPPTVELKSITEKRFNKPVLNSAARFYRYLRDGDDDWEDASFSEEFWNGSLHTVIGMHDTDEFVLGESDYYTAMSIEHKFVEEVSRALYDSDVEPDEFDGEKLAAALDASTLTSRDVLFPEAQHLAEFESVPRLPSVIAATICKTDDGDYELFWIRRSEDTAVQQGKKTIVPGGSVERLNRDGNPIEVNTYKEFVEEFFGVKGSDDLFSRVDRWMDEPGLQQDVIGVTVDPVRTSVLYASVLFADDPVVTAEIKANLNTSFEAVEVDTISLNEPGAVEEFFSGPNVSPNAVPVGLSAIRHVEEKYGVPVADDIDIDSVGL